MNAPRPNLTPAYVLCTTAVFGGAAVVIALIGRYADLPVPARNLLIIAILAAAAGMIGVMTAVVTSVQIASRIPSTTRDLQEIKEQLQHIASMVRAREPHEDDSEQMVENIARLQQNSAQTQQDLAQMQEMMRQLLDKLDILRAVASAPSPAAAALDREDDEAIAFPVVGEEDESTPIHENYDASESEVASEPEPRSNFRHTPAFTFKPTLPPEDAPAEEFETLEAARARVDDLMALSNWDAAVAIANLFAQQHPDDTDAQWLRQRVQREFDIYREGSVRRLYEQIKDELERKHYRRALSIARRLLDKFADHKKAQKIRQQLPTILENAEIEERQEDESRIQNFIKSKRYQDAVELGEALLAKYPLSPQAESLDEMLPKLRQLAIEQEAETMGRH